ncbi:MAG TPA: DNA repair protein RadC [Dehalococcoidia bacterium]|nr:DNA repair protein RadC [Dehalococcoidia bacterium]
MTITEDYRPLIRDMPADERPRERLRMRGPETLTNAELIAILLRTGVSGENAVAVGQRLLSEFGGLSGLDKVGFGPLSKSRAMGEAKACQILAAIELGQRVAGARPEERRIIRSAQDVFALLFADMALLEQEELRVVLLNARNEVLTHKAVYKGNISMVVVRLAEVFAPAVREGCESIIVVHNHPSGDPSPSAEDASLTKQLVEAGKLLGIELLDHIILARNGHASLRDLKLGFS